MSPFQRRAALLAGALVTTFSGCVGGQPQPPDVIYTNPPAPEPEVLVPELTPEPVPDPGPVSVRPPNDPPRPAPTTHIVKRENGTCVEITSKYCPPEWSCNPPPPRPVPCPSEP